MREALNPHKAVMKIKVLVTQSCPTLRDPLDCSPPDSSVHGVFQARVLEWGAIAFPECYAYFTTIKKKILLW